MSHTTPLIDPPVAPDWKNYPKGWGHPFHPMCSYMAMFPPRLPNYFIERFSDRGDLVLDPFSGRGTTATQACVSGRVGIANDLNPLAYTLCRAKIDPPTFEEAVKRLASLNKGYDPTLTYAVDDDDPIRAVYHPATLAQLSYLKERLRNNRVDTFIKATILGIMHGKYRRKGDDSIYLSIDMPNTFSMSAGYIRRYVEEHGIVPLPLDVFEKTRNRLDRLYRHGAPQTTGFAHNLDVRKLHNKISDESVRLVVTSPPYLKVVKYGLYNWIRLWFLGVPSKEVDQKLDDGHKLPEYLTFMTRVISEMERLLMPGGVCAMVIGDVASKGDSSPLNLAAAVWDAVEEKTTLRLAEIVADPIPANLKVTKIWNDKRGQATAIDRILMLSKGGPPRISHSPASINWDSVRA